MSKTSPMISLMPIPNYIRQNHKMRIEKLGSITEASWGISAWIVTHTIRLLKREKCYYWINEEEETPISRASETKQGDMDKMCSEKIQSNPRDTVPISYLHFFFIFFLFHLLLLGGPKTVLKHIYKVIFLLS